MSLFVLSMSAAKLYNFSFKSLTPIRSPFWPRLKKTRYGNLTFFVCRGGDIRQRGYFHPRLQPRLAVSFSLPGFVSFSFQRKRETAGIEPPKGLTHRSLSPASLVACEQSRERQFADLDRLSTPAQDDMRL